MVHFLLVLLVVLVLTSVGRSAHDAPTFWLHIKGFCVSFCGCVGSFGGFVGVVCDVVGGVGGGWAIS